MADRFACDLLVIGGGINGLGIAADAATRGLSVLLVEKRDFGAGTTAASSRLIHGGLRYLQYGEVGLVREALRERGLLARQRPYRVRPIRLLIPTFRGLPPSGWKLSLGLALYNLLAADPLFPPSSRLTADAVKEREPGLTDDGLTGGFLYPDAQIEFPERLCIELLRETLAAGGEAQNHTRAVGLLVDRGRVVGARLRDMIDGTETEVRARHVVNAAGPWVDLVNRLLPAPPPRLIGGTWGTHLVLPRRPEGPRGPLYAVARKDYRPFFLLPWDGRLLVGTTDVPFDGDPDDLRPQAWEVDYLLSETQRLFPGCGYTEADVQLCTIGVRPLPARGGRRDAGAITRRHFVIDHGAEHGLPGLFSVVGGKLTTYRSLAETVVNRLTPAPCRTRERGSGASLETLAAAAHRDARDLELPEETLLRLLRVYGQAWGEVVETARRCPMLRAPLPGCPHALAAEVVHAVERERARTVGDVARRRMMLLPPPEATLREIARIARERGLPLADDPD